MEINAKYKGFCSSCHHTIWKNETIRYDGQARHIDCLAAVTDKTPRMIDSKYLHLIGKLNKKKLRAKRVGAARR